MSRRQAVKIKGKSQQERKLCLSSKTLHSEEVGNWTVQRVFAQFSEEGGEL
jgi:hypothetical protein